MNRIVISAAALLISGCLSAVASGPDQTTKPPHTERPSGSGQPFSTFHEMDGLLTDLDRDAQALRAETARAAKLHSRGERMRALRAAQRSSDFSDLSQCSRRLSLVSRRAEALYRKRNQGYGALLFRDLHARAAALRAPIVSERRATTLAGFTYEQDRFSKRLLSLVLQFQAVSGGYVALACKPGGWACCQPRVVKQNARAQLHGCTWACAALASACRGGCLGPKTPRAAVAIQTKPRIPAQANRDRRTAIGAAE